MNKSQPLTGKTVLITRAAEQYHKTAELVHRAGGRPLSFPCLQRQNRLPAIADALNHVDQYSDILITSANTVQCLQQLQTQQARPLAEQLKHQRIVCVGEKTAAAASQLGLTVAFTPQAEQSSQQGLIAAYQRHGLPRALLFLRAETGSSRLIEAFRQWQIPVDMVIAYAMVCPQDDSSTIRQKLSHNDIDVVLLGSSQTAIHYIQRIGDVTLASQTAVIVISSQVADVAAQHGLNVRAIAKVPSFASMLQAAKDV